MLRVEVRHGHPFERRVEIGFHAAHHVPREALQVETLAELRGDDQLPQPWVAASCHSRSFEAISTPVASAENPVFCGLE
jgi:hypothetical protein